MPLTNKQNNGIVTSPFSLDNDELYQRWRDSKLDQYPKSLADLVVEISDPRHLTNNEFQKISQLCKKTNMAIYAGKTGDDPDPEIALSMGRAFNLLGLDNNWLGDDSGLTSLKVVNDGSRQHYIPYTNHAINWHTDGYYNTPNKQIYTLNLHCVMPAPQGGENRLMDHEVAYILLREKDPDYIRALMAPDVMTIPARIGHDGMIAREEQTGPVFSIATNSGDLHMRYTIRSRNVIWKTDPLTLKALEYLESILNKPSPYIFKGKLLSGMGLVSNNVLHDRSSFKDSETQKRLLYRARYYHRLSGTSVNIDSEFNV